MSENDYTPGIPKKRCSTCGTEFPATAEYYSAFKYGKDGLKSECRECNKKRCAQYHAKHREEANAKQTQYYRTHHGDSIRRQKEYYRRHRNERLTYATIYRNNHRDEISKKGRIYRLLPQVKIAKGIIENRRRARKLQSTGSYTPIDVELQIKAQTDKKGRLRCWWCGRVIKNNDYHIDHAIPLVRGGSNGPENIRITHPRCNLKKNAKTPAEYNNRLF